MTTADGARPRASAPADASTTTRSPWTPPQPWRQRPRERQHDARARPRRRRGHRLRPHAGAGRQALQVLREGIRCSLCSQGPCRITEKGSARRLRHRRRRHGDARLPAAEHHGRRRLHLPRRRGHEDPRAGQARRHLRDQGLGQARAARRRRRRRLEPQDTLPKRVADAIWAEFNRDHQSTSPLVETFAPRPRVDAWKKLGIMPGGVLHENNARHHELHDQHRRRLREPRAQGPAPGHRHRLRRADPARAGPGRAVGHAHAARRSRSTSASSTPST